MLSPAGHQEGEDTRGWAIGNGWLTLLRGKQGNPCNMAVGFELETAQEADPLQQAFIVDGGKGPAPSDQLICAHPFLPGDRSMTNFVQKSDVIRCSYY